MSLADYIAYIDEAGDDGFSMLGRGVPTGQSRHLILGGIIVLADNDHLVPQWRDDILAAFRRPQTRDLHFRDLNHDQKVVACQKIAGLPIGSCLVLSNKSTIVGSSYERTFATKGYLYNYMVRWLLERLTTAARVGSISPAEACSLKVVFSRRKGMDYDAMHRYLRKMRDGRELMRPVRSIDWSVLNVGEIEVENHSKRAGLQLADCVTSAFFAAVERNAYGNYESRYALTLKNTLIDTDGQILNCGLAPIPSFGAFRPDPEQRAFIMDCIKK